MALNMRDIKDGSVVDMHYNRVAGLLWGKMLSKEVKINKDLDGHVSAKSEVGSKKIVKAKKFEIFFLKYGIVLLAIYFLNTYTFHHDSLIGLGLSALLYAFSFWSIKKFDYATVVILYALVFGGIAVGIGMYGFNNLGRDEYGVIYILNYMVQSLILVRVFHYIYNDLHVRGYDNYYRIEGNAFRYMRLGPIKRDLSSGFKWFGLGLALLGVTVLALGTPKYIKKVLVINATQKKIEENTKKDEAVTQKNYTKEQIKRLDYMCKGVGVRPIHRQKVFGIESYSNVLAMDGMKYSRINAPLDKSVISSIQGLVDMDLLVSKLDDPYVYKGESMTMKGFTKDSYNFFFHKTQENEYVLYVVHDKRVDLLRHNAKRKAEALVSNSDKNASEVKE